MEQKDTKAQRHRKNGVAEEGGVEKGGSLVGQGA